MEATCGVEGTSSTGEQWSNTGDIRRQSSSDVADEEADDAVFDESLVGTSSAAYPSSSHGHPDALQENNDRGDTYTLLESLVAPAHADGQPSGA